MPWALGVMESIWQKYWLCSVTGLLVLIGSFAIADEFASIVTPSSSIVYEALGGELRPIYHDALSLVEDGDIEGALKKIEPVISFCQEKVTATEKLYLAFKNQDEYDRYLLENPATDKLIWLDIVCPDSFGLIGFIFAGLGESDDAILWLNRDIAAAPYLPAPHSERGYVLDQRREFEAALGEYEIAVKLAEEFPASANERARAYRGMGFSLIELNRLDEAEEAFEKSLNLEPGNSLAKEELLYIDGLRSE